MRIAPLLALLVAVPAWAGAPYTSAKLKFTATFPYEVKENVESDGGGTAAAFDAAGVMYMVGVSPSDPAVGKTKSVKQQLDDGLEGALARVHGTAESQKDVKLGAYPGREVEIALQGGHATFRFFIVGTRSYMIGVVHKDGATPPTAPADFFKTFKVQK